MANEIENRLNHLDITDRSDDSANKVAQPNDKNANMEQHYHGQKAKETRRISLPAEAQLRSKFSSWVQHSLPTPPSSRNNSNGSQHRGRSNKRTSIASSTSSGDRSSTFIPSPTSSPTITSSPQLPLPRTSSLQPNHATKFSTAQQQQPENDNHGEGIPHIHHRSSSTSSCSSTKSNHNKKKRFLPTVPRVRLCQSEKCCKRKQRVLVEPPEPPPQLLISALHYHNQDAINKRKSASHNNLEAKPCASEENDQSQSTMARQDICTAQSPCYDNQNRESIKDSNNRLSLDTSSVSHYQRRRRSSCPSKYSANITSQESIMLQSFCSPVNSLLINHASRLSSPPPSKASTLSSSSPPPSSSTSSSFVQQDVFDHDHHCVLSFSTMKPRSRPLRRRTSGKKEKKAFRVWHDSLVESLKNEPEDALGSFNRVSSTSSMEQQSALSKEKRERNALTRKFILGEFYLTEVTFWNQLYYTKVMFSDPLQQSIDRHSSFTKSSDMDMFSNLPDLMQCSSQLIRAMTPFLDNPPVTAKIPASEPISPTTFSEISGITTYSTPGTNIEYDQIQQKRPAALSNQTLSSLSSPSSASSEASNSTWSLASTSTSASSSSFRPTRTNMLPVHLEADAGSLPSPNDQLLLGKELCAMASQFVVFLRCALDYRSNRKRLDHKSQHSKGFAVYQEKLALRRETNQFYVHDYLIIPIQRITRYGLLLADLQKHTERHHPDYHYLTRARMIFTALAVAMNKAQHK